jgi:hypothetical protein
MAIETKRTVTIVNAFIISTAEFLNQFSSEIHIKLGQISRQIEKLEAMTYLLEHKLKNLPDISTPNPPPQSSPQVQSQPDSAHLSATTPPSITTPGAPPTPQPQVQEQPPEPQQEIDEEYKLYVRMIKVGVPRQAVKAKMASDGKDPNVLDTIIPPEEN